MSASQRRLRYYFPSFVPCGLGFERSLSILTGSARSLLRERRAEFADVIASNDFKQFLDSFLRISWRPHDQVSLREGSVPFMQWLELRQQVLDVLCRAVQEDLVGTRSGITSNPLLTPAAAIDMCSLYVYDAEGACSQIMQALLGSKEFQVALIAAIPLARLPLEQLEGSLTRKQNETGYQGIVECMEDIAASLVATVTAAPQISRYLISGTDQPVLLTLRNWHDILIPKLAMEDQSVDRTALEAIAGSCCWLALQILQHGVIRHHCSESVALSYGIPTPSISDELLPLLMNMKSSPARSTSKILLEKLPIYGLLQLVDQSINDHLLHADSNEYAYLLALIGDPGWDRPGTQKFASLSSRASGMHVLSSISKPSQRSAVSASTSGTASEQQIVKGLQQMFPGCDSDFLHACCQSIGWNLEKVANALLTNSLPAPLQVECGTAAVNTGTPPRQYVQIHGRRQMDLDWNKSKKDLVQRTLVLIQSQECHDAEYNDEYDDSFDALGGHTGRDGEAEAESSKHAALAGGSNAHNSTGGGPVHAWRDSGVQLESGAPPLSRRGKNLGWRGSYKVRGRTRP